MPANGASNLPIVVESFGDLDGRSRTAGPRRAVPGSRPQFEAGINRFEVRTSGRLRRLDVPGPARDHPVKGLGGVVNTSDNLVGDHPDRFFVNHFSDPWILWYLLRLVATPVAAWTTVKYHGHRISLVL